MELEAARGNTGVVQIASVVVTVDVAVDDGEHTFIFSTVNYKILWYSSTTHYNLMVVAVMTFTR